MAWTKSRFIAQCDGFAALAQAVIPPHYKVQYEQDSLANPRSPSYRSLTITDGHNPVIEVRLYDIESGAPGKGFAFFADDLWTQEQAQVLPVAVPGDVVEALSEIRAKCGP